ncbi:hypothetical protein NDA14_000972 [Ustilago hordei]|nr:hypothetical protein NDA14_000972 [Ustilago hordei]
MYIYDLATTGRISFSDFLVTTDLVSQVSQTTQLRARLGAVLKENRAATSILFSSSATSSSQSECKDGAVGNTDWLSIIKRIEEYLPHLLGVFNSVQTDDLLLRYEPVFSWRTWISCSRLGGAGRMQLPGLYYELASTLLTYSLTLSNLAASAVDGLGSFETNRSLSWQQRKDKDDKLRWAADTLCRASGILLLLSTELLPKWKVSVGSVEVLPPDLTQEATLALSKVCLAEAQALAIPYKWLGIDAAESSNKIGTAITLLSLSTSILSSATLRNLTSSLCNISISSSTLLPTKKRGKTGDRGVVDQELATVEHWLQSYKKLNDTVSFQPIPPAAEVQAKVPAGRAALLVKKYSLPSPEWGPGSQGYRGRGGEGLSREEMHLLGDQHPARRNLVGMDGGGSGEATSGDGGGGRVAYAGQGAYY